jgi:MATE family multidrug resistance protein
VVNTYVSQHLGAGKPREGAAYAWNGLWLCVVAWVLVLLPAAAALPWVFEAMRGVLGLGTPPGRVTEFEVEYGRILLVGMLFMLLARSIGHFFYGVHRPTVVMVSAIAANLVNVVLCYGLVLGEFGLPAMGVAGAALSTGIGGLVEFLIPMGLFLSRRYAERYATRTGWAFSWFHVKGLLRIGWPAGAMTGNEVLCWWIFLSGFLPSYDTEATGPLNAHAGQVALQYMHLSFMPAVGMSIALTSVVGKQVGAGRLVEARRRTWQGLALTVGYMSVCALCFVVFREPMVRLFVAEPGAASSGGGVAYTAGQVERIVEIGSVVLIIAACFQLFDGVAIALSGALRGAGDTVWPGVATLVFSWTFIVGGGWAMVSFAPGFGSYGPWLGATAFLVALAGAFMWRFLSGAWERFAVVERRGDEAERAEAVERGVLEAEAEAGAGVGTL